jgi:hypothetical protein
VSPVMYEVKEVILVSSFLQSNSPGISGRYSHYSIRSSSTSPLTRSALAGSCVLCHDAYIWAHSETTNVLQTNMTGIMIVPARSATLTRGYVRTMLSLGSNVVQCSGFQTGMCVPLRAKEVPWLLVKSKKKVKLSP